MNTDRISEIRAGLKSMRTTASDYVPFCSQDCTADIIIGFIDLTESMLSEIDRLKSDNAELTKRAERAEKRLGAAVEDMKVMALAMRESEELSEACCFACICDAQNLPDDVILAYGECPGYDRDDCFEWRGLDEQEDKSE